MKKLTIAVLALFSCCSLAGAQVNFYGGPADLKAELARLELLLPEAGRPAGLDKEWTIMVFINAKNNLEEYGLLDVNEMELVGSGARLNVVVELARIKGFDASDGDWKTARRYLVQKDNDFKKIGSPVVEELAGVDMGDYRHLAEFGKWAKTRYPAKKYMLIVWNHGAGWIKGAAGPGRGISYDDETRHHITIPELGLALREMGGVDVYGSDACLMQMAEVVYELKDQAAYIVGSEETEPGDGYTYSDFLTPLAARPGMAPEELARIAVDTYADHYKDTKEGSTQSYVRTSALAGFLAAADNFTRALIKAGEKEMARKAMTASQGYSYPENRDLYHFAQLVAGSALNAEVKKAAQDLMANISGSLVGHNRTTDGYGSWTGPGAGYKNSHGIAVYLPGTAAPVHYAELQWAKASGWDDFIAWLARP